MDRFLSDNQLVEAEREEAEANPAIAPTPQERTPLDATSRRGLFPSWGDLLAIIGLFFVSQIMTRAIFAMLDLDIPLLPSVDDLSTLERRDAEYALGYNIFLWSIISQPLLLAMVLIYRQLRGGGHLWGKVRYSVRGLNPTVLLWGIILLLSVVVVIEPLMQLLPKAEASYGRGFYMTASILLVAPIFEELLCRGIIFESVRAKWGAWAACIISSVIFGMMHIEPQFVLNAFIIGIVLCYLYLRTRSIFAPMIIHSLNNLFAYMLLIFGVKNITLYEMVGGGTIYTIIYGAAVVILIISATLIWRQISRLDKEELAKSVAAEAKTKEKSEERE